MAGFINNGAILEAISRDGGIVFEIDSVVLRVVRGPVSLCVCDSFGFYCSHSLHLFPLARLWASVLEACQTHKCTARSGENLAVNALIIAATLL